MSSSAAERAPKIRAATSSEHAVQSGWLAAKGHRDTPQSLEPSIYRQAPLNMSPRRRDRSIYTMLQ